jgi:hypothetical protein
MPDGVGLCKNNMSSTPFGVDGFACYHFEPWVSPMAIERFDPFRIINILQIRETNIFKNHDHEVVQLFNNRG